MKLFTIYNHDGFFWGEYHIKKPINATERIYTGSYIKPKYSVQDDNFYESATAEEIEQAESERCKPVLSRMVFFRNVWRVLQLTEDDILAEVEKIEDVNERVEIRNMVRNASEFERQHPDLIRMSKKMGIPEQVLNQIFQ